MPAAPYEVVPLDVVQNHRKADPYARSFGGVDDEDNLGDHGFVQDFDGPGDFGASTTTRPKVRRIVLKKKAKAKTQPTQPTQSTQPVVVYQPAEDAPEEASEEVQVIEVGWPEGWYEETGAAPAGPRMSVVPRPSSGITPAVVEIRPGLFLVGEIPEDLAFGGDEAGILPLLVPAIIKAAQKGVNANRVHIDRGHDRGVDLVDRDDDDDMGHAPGRGRGGRFRFHKPRWMDREDATEMGFGGGW